MGSSSGIDEAALLALYSEFAVNQENVPQWRGYLEHRLLMARCRECRQWMNPPAPMCARCWSERIEFEEVSGRGKVQWFSLLYPRSGQPGGPPYPAVVVELAEQPQLRMATTIVECDPFEIRCDAEVELTWIDPDGAPVPAFRLSVTDDGAPGVGGR